MPGVSCIQTRKQRSHTCCGFHPSVGYQRRKGELLDSIKFYEAKGKIVEKMPIPLGRVLVSSGSGVTVAGGEAHIMDWAFVEINKGSAGLIGTNAIPRPDSKFKMPEDFGVGTKVLTFPGRASRFSEMVAGEGYFKAGRTTGLTSGICNGAEAHVPSQHVRYDDEGKRTIVRVNGKATKEYALVEGVREEDQKSVSRPGDSGPLSSIFVGGLRPSPRYILPRLWL